MDITVVTTFIASPTNVPMDAYNAHGYNMSANLTPPATDYPDYNVTDYPSLSSEAVSVEPIHNCQFFNFIMYTLLLGVICMVGIFGNTLSIFVLAKDKRNDIAVFLLQSLAIADNAILLMSMFVLSINFSFLPFVNRGDLLMTIMPYLVKYVNPIGYMSQTAAIWLTVLLALNRYIAICRPFESVHLCTLNRVKFHVVVVFILSILINVPRFFQFDIVTNSETGQETYAPTNIGEQTTFGIIYTNILYTLFVLILPLILLLYLNVKLICELYAVTRRNSFGHGRHNREEDNVTRIMVVIVIVFIMCHTPDRIQQITRYFIEKQPTCGHFLYYTAAVCNILICLNSSSNFFIYCFLRRRFRDILFTKIIRCNCLKRYKKQKETANGALHTLSLLEPSESVVVRKSLVCSKGNSVVNDEAGITAETTLVKSVPAAQQEQPAHSLTNGHCSQA